MSTSRVFLGLDPLLIEMIERTIPSPNEINALEDGWVVIMEWWDFYRTKMILLTLSEESIEISRTRGSKIIEEEYFPPNQMLEIIYCLQNSLKEHLKIIND